jgi:hypothetical protein
MARRLPTPLRLVFQRHGDSTPPPDVDEAPPAPPEVEFVAYGEDCVLSGRLAMPADRLTDLLNAHDQYVLVDVLVERLADGSAIEVHELAISRDEILVVHATGPRGNPSRRQRTRQHPIAVRLGPYEVRGYIHALPGSDPIDSLRRRNPMVPLTEAWVEYSAGGTVQRRHVSSLVINRELMDWAVEASDEEIQLPELPVSDEDRGPLVKDFTGLVLADVDPDLDARDAAIA